MKLLSIKKQLRPILHLLFWMISLNVWYVVFNPGVESTGAIKGLQDYWLDLLLLNILFYLYCLLPFVWFVPSARRWLKMALTVLFVLPLIYLLFLVVRPGEIHEDISLFTDLFLSGFMYVVVFHLTIAGAVYFNLYLLIDRYLKAGRFGAYLLAILLLAVLAAVLNFALFDWGIDLLFRHLYFVSYYQIWELAIIIGLYLVATTAFFLIWQYALVLIARRDQVQNELSALKAQINPHFLFNNLNTIYSLASNQDVRTKEVILQLSDFLRYVLYDTASEFIPLDKEVEIMETYIELQKSRIDPNVTTVNLTKEGDFALKRITPLLLLPLVENCFKHGVGKKPGKIDLYLGLNENELLFTAENVVAPREQTGMAANGGIGINNVKKRLNLLYADRHSLRMEEKGGRFRVELRLELY